MTTTTISRQTHSSKTFKIIAIAIIFKNKSTLSEKIQELYKKIKNRRISIVSKDASTKAKKVVLFIMINSVT